MNPGTIYDCNRQLEACVVYWRFILLYWAKPAPNLKITFAVFSDVDDGIKIVVGVVAARYIRACLGPTRSNRLPI